MGSTHLIPPGSLASYNYDPVDYAIIKTKVENLDRCVFGPPTLEQRTNKYTDDRDTHKQAGTDDALGNIKDEMKHDREVNDKRHDANQGEIKSMARMLNIGIGMLLLLQALGISGIAVLLAHKGP